MFIMSLLPEILTIVGGICKIAVLVKSEQLNKKTVVETDDHGNITSVNEEYMPMPSEIVTGVGIGALDMLVTFDTTTFKNTVEKYKLMDKERKDIFWLQMGSYACTFGAFLGWRERVKIRDRKIKDLQQNYISKEDVAVLENQCNTLVDGIRDDVTKLHTVQNQINNKAVHPSWIDPYHPDFNPTDLANLIINSQYGNLEALLTEVGEV